MDDNISKGLFGLNRKEVENYIYGMRSNYEAELKRQNSELMAMKAENARLTESLNEMMNAKKSVDEAKFNISEVLIKAEQQAKTIVEDARNQAMEEKQQIDDLIEIEKQKLNDTRAELAMLKDRAKTLVNKFTDDLSSLQQE